MAGFVRREVGQIRIPPLPLRSSDRGSQQRQETHQPTEGDCAPQADLSALFTVLAGYNPRSSVPVTNGCDEFPAWVP